MFNLGMMKKEAEIKKKEATLKLSIKEGAATSVMGGAGEAYIVPYALALNANNVQVGFLSSFVGLFGSIAQIWGSKAVYNKKRKSIIFVSVTLQATMWLLIVALGLLVWKGYINGIAALVLILFYTLYAFSGNFAGPSWFSMMGDLVSKKGRGEYFSKRNKITGFVALTATLLAAFVLDYFRNRNIVLLGFAIIFLTASLARFVSAYMFSKHYDPPTNMKKESYFGFWQFVKKAPSNNFGKFVIYVALINLVTNFAGPFFAVYMLKELNFSYTLFTIINISGTVFTILSLSFWGKIGDKYGNRKLLTIGSFIIPFAPLFWVFSGNPWYLIFTAQLAAGLGWAAFNLAASNFIYDSVSRERRAICVAYYSILNGVGVFAGAIFGGLFAQYVHITFMNVLLLIFLISAIMRILVVWFFLPGIKEVREVPTVEDVNLLKHLIIGTPGSFLGFFRGIYSGVTHITVKLSKTQKILS
jgi:MFS family permease